MDLIRTYLSETWLLIAEMGPYLLIGFFVSGLLHHWIREAWIQSLLGKPGMKSIAMASLIGVPMPLCSCGVIPVTASLRSKGASKGAAASFLTSTPQTGVDSILATYGLLGPVFAAYRVFVAFLSGFAAGALIERFGKEQASPEKTDTSNESQDNPTWGESLNYGSITLPADIASSLVIGFLLAGLISALAPENLLTDLPGGIITSLLLTTLIATPFYICSTGSIPLALALIGSGLPVSAALVLLIAGPATNAATISTMRKTLGGRETAIYVGSIVGTSWIAALIYHLFFPTQAFSFVSAHVDGPSLVHHLSGIALIAMLAFAYWRVNGVSGSVSSGSKLIETGNSEVVTLEIDGMTCNHCRESARQGLASLPFTERAEVDLKTGKAIVSGENLDIEAMAAKLKELGFSLKKHLIQSAP